VFVLSDLATCSTFAHNFILKTFACARDEGLVLYEKFKFMERNLIQHNTITDGTTGETEGTSRTNQVLGEPTGASAEASARSYVIGQKVRNNMSG
jgi:hypothetical protein